MLYLAASDGRGPTRIATHISAFSWSPDGSRIAYSSAGARGIVIADANGRAVPRRVTIAATVGAASGDVQWSPDASLIAFATSRGVFVVRPDGTSLRHVMAGGQIAWSPDSRVLAVARAIDVYVVRADGGGLRRIAHCPCTFRVRRERLSPGRRTAVASRTSADAGTT